VVAAIVWVAAAIATGVLFLVFQGGEFHESGAVDEVFQYAQLIEQAANAATLCSLTVYVVLWLERRRRSRSVSGASGTG